MAAAQLLTVRSLAWALLFGGWLQLGELGRALWPLWAAGLVPVALWLASAALAIRFGGERAASAPGLRTLLLLSGLSTAVALCWATGGAGGSPALAFGSISWGLLLVAASRAVGAVRAAYPLRSPATQLPSPATAAALGAALAWTAAADPVQAVHATASFWPLCAAGLLAALVPARGSARGCRAGLFDCALAAGSGHEGQGPMAVASIAARWTMLPMMASLAYMSQWCSEGGTTPAQTAALHLGTMLLPALLFEGLRSCRAGPWPPWVSPLGTATAMSAGLVMLALQPGLQGLMIASMCHALAWGLAWHGSLTSRRPACARHHVSHPAGAVAPACVVLTLGLALDEYGPQALQWVHAALGLAACAAWPLAATASRVDRTGKIL